MSDARLFGTDGVRGVANQDLTAPLALHLGMAAGQWARTHASGLSGAGRPTVIIGRDTRRSGDMLEAALAAGLAATGALVVNIGVAPTPAVAQIVLARQAAAGVVISASHNPFEDNGIKFFGPNGKKLPDKVEDEIEALIGRLDTLPPVTGGDIGVISDTRQPIREYVARVLATLPGNLQPVFAPGSEDLAVEITGVTASPIAGDGAGRAATAPLAGLRLVMDCAEGAAYELGPQIFRALGADVQPLHVAPNGVNINAGCGSTRPQTMQAAVRARGGDGSVGLAFDGDADRVMLADENGEIVDGDRMMAIIALHLHAQGRLPGDVVVATIMSNVGLEQALGAHGVRLHRTDVGDRYVAEAMDALGAAVGGEQSGHILLPYLTPTGDGMVTALQVLAVMRETGKPLAELAIVMQSGPQLLQNVRVRTRQGWRDDVDIQRAITQGSERLGSAEWLSVRASGTEPLIRVMAQGTDRAVVEAVVQDICAVVTEKLGRE